MSTLIKKNQKSNYSILKEAREKAGYSIAEISNRLNIRKAYLINIEEENYNNLPGQPYINGYIKMYYKFLGLTPPLQEEKYNDNNTKKTILKISSIYYKKYIIITTIPLVFLIIWFNITTQDKTNNINKKISNTEFPYFKIDNFIPNSNSYNP